MNRSYRNVLNVVVALLIMSAIVLAPTVLVRILAWSGTHRILSTEYLSCTPWELTQSQPPPIVQEDIVPIRISTLTFSNPFGQCEVIEKSSSHSSLIALDLGKPR